MSVKKDIGDLATIMGVAFAIMCGLLLGGFVTNAALEYFVESLIR